MLRNQVGISNDLASLLYCRSSAEIITSRTPSAEVELLPTLMIDDAETKMRTDAAVLFELKTSVLFFHTLQICELIYVAVYLATGL
jgi:hypothetical protein